MVPRALRIVAERTRPIRISSGERASATTTTGSLRILKYEALLHQVFEIIERGVVKVKIAFRVHKNTSAILFEDLFAVARFSIQAHRVSQSGAAASLHTYTQPTGLGRYAFFCQQFADFRRCFFAYVNHMEIRFNLRSRRRR